MEIRRIAVDQVEVLDGERVLGVLPLPLPYDPPEWLLMDADGYEKRRREETFSNWRRRAREFDDLLLEMRPIGLGTALGEALREPLFGPTSNVLPRDWRQHLRADAEALLAALDHFEQYPESDNQGDNL